MPDPDFTIKTGDTGSALQATLENSGGTPVSIQGATVLFKMIPIAGGTTVIAATATIDQISASTLTGQVHYNWATSDVQTAGLYLGEWEVTYSSGTVQTFPNGDPFRIRINEDF